MLKGVTEGLGDAMGNVISNAPKNALGAVAQDITKNSGLESTVQGFINDIFAKAKIDNRTMERVKDWKAHKDAANSFSKTIKGKDLAFIRDDLKNRSDDDSLFKFYRWIFYIRKYISKERDDIIIQEEVKRITDLSSDSKNIASDPNLKKIQREITVIYEDKVQQVVDKNEKAFKDEYNKAASSKTKLIPERSYMSFKSFNESIEKKLKEADANIDQLKKKELKTGADAAKAKAALAIAAANNAKKAAAKKPNQTSDIGQIVATEGVYAGGNGIKKKIPFTQNPMLQTQAVGPKTDEDGEPIEDEKVDDEEVDNAEARQKKLDKLSKKLQDLADESCDVAMNNIDPTEDTLIGKMEAKEKSGLKESQDSWAKMEKKLQKLDESCAGGACTIGGRQGAAAGNGGSTGNWGIAPIGTVGQLSMPPTAQQIPQVADRSTIYSFIKDNDLGRTSRDYALNVLLSQYGNSSTELSQILSDVILSDGNPTDMDGSYGYASDSLLPVEPELAEPPEDFTQDRESTQDRLMAQAWGQMETKLNDL